MAARVLCNCVDEFPDGKSNGKSSTKQRGKVDLCKYSQTKGVYATNSNREQYLLWDQELFMTQMEHLRGWKAERAVGEWNRLKNSPGIGRDEKGPAHCIFAWRFLGT